MKDKIYKFKKIESHKDKVLVKIKNPSILNWINCIIYQSQDMYVRTDFYKKSGLWEKEK